MKSTLLLAVFLMYSLLPAEELGLEGDSSSIPSLEESLKEFGADDLIVEEVKPASKPSVTIKPEQESPASSPTTKAVDSAIAKADSTPIITTAPAESTTNAISSTQVADTTKSAAVPVDSTVQISYDTTASVKVNSVSSVDIESSLKDYRSPLKALFFSLVVPGAGQAYTKKYWKSGLFVAAEVAAIVGAVHFKKTGDEIQAQAHTHMDTHFDEKRLSAFYTDLYKYGLGKFDTAGVQLTLFNNIYKGDSTGTAVENYMENFVADRYGNGKQLDAVQGWVDASPSYNPNASGNTPFYLVSGTNLTIDTTGLKLLGDAPFGTSALQNQYISLLKSSEKRYDWSQTMIVALLVNHAVSAMDAFISAHRHNRKMMNEKVEQVPQLSLNNSVYRNEIGAMTTSLDLVWKF